MGNISRRLKKLKRHVDGIPKDAYQDFKKITPIDTGNARRSTDFVSGDSIRGNYDYANRLNSGWSRQAPGGMTDPTIDTIRSNLRKL